MKKNSLERLLSDASINGTSIQGHLEGTLQCLAPPRMLHLHGHIRTIYARENKTRPK